MGSEPICQGSLKRVDRIARAIQADAHARRGRKSGVCTALAKPTKETRKKAGRLTPLIVGASADCRRWAAAILPDNFTERRSS